MNNSIFDFNNKITIVLISILLVSLSVGVSLLDYVFNKGSIYSSLILIFLIFCLILLASVGVKKVLVFSLFFTLAFNIEYPMIAINNGYTDSHPGGLRAAIVINHFIIIIMFWFATHLKEINNTKKINNNYFKSPELFLYLMMVLTACVSFLFAPNKLAAAYPVMRLLFMYVLIILLGNLKLDNIWNMAIKAWVILVPIQLFIGLGQYITGEALGLRFLGESKEPFRSTTLVGEGEKGLSGTLGHPGTMGLFFILITPILINTYLNSDKNTRHNKNLLGFSILMCFLIVVLTDARTSMAILVLALGLLTVGNLHIRSINKLSIKKIMLFVCLLFFMVMVLVVLRYDQLVERFGNSDFVYQIYYRLGLSELSLTVIGESLKNVFLGVGPNNYTDVLATMGSGFAYTNPVHNFYLLLFVENGVLHMLIYIGILFVVVIRMLKVIRNGILDLSYKALSILISIICLGVYNFTGWSAYHNQNFILFTILCVFSVKIYDEYKARN